MADEKISAMPSAGALDGTELIPVVRLGVPNLNLSTTTAIVGALATTLVQLGVAVTYTLANGTRVGQRVAIVDNLGAAQANHPVISGAMNIGPSITLTQNFSSIEGLWNGSQWVILL